MLDSNLRMAGISLIDMFELGVELAYFQGISKCLGNGSPPADTNIREVAQNHCFLLDQVKGYLKEDRGRLALLAQRIS